MKKLLNRENFELLLEQAIFSIYNFLIVINLYKNLNTIEIAAIGVNITALYGSVSISRNIISGDFTQSKFPFSVITIQDTLKIALRRGLSVVPVVSIVMLFSCTLTKTDFETSLLIVLISVEVIFVDNFRQIQILHHKFRFMIISLVFSIIITFLIMRLLDQNHNFTWLFWFFTLLVYLIAVTVKYKLYSAKISCKEFMDFNFVSRKSITLESFSNHTLFYLYNLIFFQVNPILSGEIRLITAWIVNSASSLYITLNNFYAIKLVNHNSDLKEQKNINWLAILALMCSSVIFYQVHYFFYPVGNAEIDLWLILGTCISSVTFFIHSRISILILHGVQYHKFFSLRFLTWSLILSLQLFPTIFFGENGFIAGSSISFVYVLRIYNLALMQTNLLR